MNHAKKYLEYAGAFEETYEDDDWSRLEPFFTPDAAFSSTGGPPLGGRWEGRQNVLDQLRESVNTLDRRFDKRSVELLGAPEIGEDTIEIKWKATYQKAGAPDLVFEGGERATFEGDRIRLLEDTIEDGADERVQAYLARHFD
jgi:hypothetical protein